MSEPSLAQLGIRVDSDGVVEATDNLEALVDAGANAERSAKGVESSWASAMAGLRGDTSQIVQELKALNTIQAGIAQQMAAIGKAAIDSSASFTAAAQAQAGFAASTDSAAQAGQRMVESADEQSARMAAVVKASLEASQYHQTLTGAISGTASAMDAASKSATDWAAYQAEINARGQTLLATEERLAQEAKKAAAATDLQADGLQKLLGQIDPAVAALDRLDDQQAKLAKYKAAGLLDTETFRDYSAKIDQTRQKLGGFDDGLKATESASNQTKAALAQLPAQLSDIIVSLSGGQSPFTVLLQQGSQIKDSFGGIGPMFEALSEKAGSFFGLASAAGALGGAVGDIGEGAKAAAKGADEAGESLGGMAEGLNTASDAAKNAGEAVRAIPPVPGGVSIGFVGLATVAAAAVTAIALVTYGMKAGGDEADEYKKSLILSGNAAGTSAGQLSDLARQIGAVNGTVGDAAALLSDMAGKGKIARESFESIANAAISMEKATGRAVGDVIGEFTKIAEDPVKAAKSLNEEYGFLTAAVYSQIVSLKEQQKEEEAARLLTDTYAGAIKTRTTEIVENLGFVEKAWRSVKKAAGDTVDGIKDLGRDETINQQIAALDKKLRFAENLSSEQRKQAGYDEGEIKSWVVMRGFLRERLDSESAIAKAQGNYAENQRKGIDAMSKVDALEKSSASNADKRVQKIKELNSWLDDIRKADANDRRLDADYIAQRIKNINDQFKDKKGSSTTAPLDLRSFNDAENALKSLNSTYENSMRVLDAAQKAGAISQSEYTAQKSALLAKQKTDVEAAYQAEISALETLKGREKLSAAQRIELDNKIADAKQKQTDTLKKLSADQEIIAKETEGQLKRQEAAFKAFAQSVDDSLALAQRGLEQQLAGFGLGQEARKRLQEDLKIREDYQKKLEQLARDYAKIEKPSEEQKALYDRETGYLREALDKRLSMQEDYYRKLEAAQANWVNGATAAWQDYVDAASDVAGQTYDVFSNAFQGMEDALVEFAMTGKLSFKDLANSIIADIARIVIRTKIVAPMINAVFGGGGGGGGIASALGGGGSGGGFNLESAWNTASSAYSVATSGFGNAVSAGWTAGEGFLGGVQGALKAGSGYLTSTVSSLFSSSSGTMVNGVYQLSSSAAPATVDLIANTVSNSSTGVVTGTATGATTAATTGLAASSAVMYGIGGAIQGYLKAGVKGAVAGAGGAVAGAYAGAAIGSAIPIIGTAIGAAIGAVLGGMFGSSLFGGDWITKDEGFQLGVTDGDLESYSFEYQKKKGGLFSSNKKRTRLTAMDEEMQAALDATYATTLGSVIGLFDSLDVTLNDAVLDGLNVAATQISTRDKTAEEIQKEIADWFTVLADSAVGEVNKVTGSGLEGFNFESLTTFVSNLYSVNTSLEMIGVEMVGFNIAGGRAVENLVSLAGGIESLNKNMTTFYDNFTTDAQKATDVLDGVRSQFASMGLTLPATREAFAEVVKGLDMTSEAERQIFTSMTANAEQAAAAYTILEQRQAKYYELFGNQTQKNSDVLADAYGKFFELGKIMPQSRAGYVRLIESISTSTEAGQRLSESLMGLAESADAAYTLIERQASAERSAVISARQAVEAARVAEQEALVTAYGEGAAAFSDLLKSLMSAGDAVGYVSAQVNRWMADPSGNLPDGVGSNGRVPRWGENGIDSAGAYNYETSLIALAATRQFNDLASANALRMQNVALKSLPTSVSQYDPAFNGQYTATQDWIGKLTGEISESGQAMGYAIRDAMAGAVEYFTASNIDRRYGSNAQGLAAIAKAQQQLGLAESNSDVALYEKTLSRLGWEMGRGQVTAGQYETSVGVLNQIMADAAYLSGDLERQELRLAKAREDYGQAGLSSVGYYFGEMSKWADELAIAAQEANDPLAQVARVIGEMNSAATAFGTSAAAAATLSGGRGDKAAGQSQLVADAAAIASGIITTQAAAEAAKLLAKDPAFKDLEAAGIRDAALLLGDIGAFDADGLQDAFVRISAALGNGTINEAQYKALFNTAADLFEDVGGSLASEIAKVEDAFKAVRDAAKSLADELLVSDMSSLSDAQRMAEAQRQYQEVLAKAKAGDADAAGDLSGVTNTMLELARLTASTATDYNRVFGLAIADLRELEALKTVGLPTSGPRLATGGPVVGPGTGTSDSILAHLSNGEYVINAAAVRALGMDALDTLNSGRLPGFSVGGPVGETGPVLQITKPSQIYSNNSSAQKTGSKDDAATVAELKALREEMKSNFKYIAQHIKSTADSADQMANGGVKINGTVSTKVATV